MPETEEQSSKQEVMLRFHSEEGEEQGPYAEESRPAGSRENIVETHQNHQRVRRKHWASINKHQLFLQDVIGRINIIKCHRGEVAASKHVSKELNNKVHSKTFFQSFFPVYHKTFKDQCLGQLLVASDISLHTAEIFYFS